MFRLSEDEATDVLRQVVTSTAWWTEEAKEHDIDKAEIERMSLAFEHDQMEAARALTV